MDEILKALLPSGILTPILFFLLWFWFSERLKASIRAENEKELTNHKARIEHDYNEKLASHTAKLNRDTELELAEFKHKLELAATERNFRFSHTFEKTAEVIVGVYQRLLELQRAADTYTQLMEPSDDPNRAAELRTFKEKANEFSNYYFPNKIYIPPETDKKIRELNDTLYRSVTQFGMAQAVGKSATRAPETYGKLFDDFFKSSGQVPEMLRMLEADFQRILGFPESKPEVQVSATGKG
jgi:hypothetical protein